MAPETDHWVSSPGAAAATQPAAFPSLIPRANRAPPIGRAMPQLWLKYDARKRLLALLRLRVQLLWVALDNAMGLRIMADTIPRIAASANDDDAPRAAPAKKTGRARHE